MRALGEAWTESFETVRLVVSRASQHLHWNGPIRTGDSGLAVLQHDIVARGLQHIAGNRDELLADFLRRQQSGAAGDDKRAAGECAPAIGRAVGVAVHDAHIGRHDADRVSDDLRKRCRQALAVRACADAGLDLA
jgi:hypothetical protein